MNNLKTSPKRNTFHKDCFLGRTSESEMSTEENQAILNAFDTMIFDQRKKEKDPKWAENNLEYDLRTSGWFCDKVKKNTYYAQNLYAALCNNEFTKIDVIQILKESKWSCSWRYAGGIVADMREEGDYIDWYCSGIDNDPSDTKSRSSFVAEGTVTDEVKNDLQTLGWLVTTSDDDF